MTRRKFFAAAVNVALASTCLAGCSALPGGDPDPTLNPNQAVKRVDAVLDDTFKTVRPELKWRDGPIRTTEGRNSFTNTSNGELTVGRTRYVRTKVSKEKLSELIKAVDTHWRREGFKVGELNPERPSLSATAPDGCTIKLSVGGVNNVYFDAGVGAISPGRGFQVKGEEGDKFPKAPNGGPDYTPDVRDRYWST
ncbi:hypothetical protein [Streptomyces noursei]|uniref:hypothetical protein n=1 Tax=Streptomyces noursei TaxID=1971 RepID=UPI0016722CE7|nr:hypothetical protein [Streptomyces noursei]MCZ1018357.1 hypothetical protein [Streptomyces noursei]